MSRPIDLRGGCSDAIDEQLQKLARIADGWLDGGGKAPTIAAMAKAADIGRAANLLRLATPYLYPTEAGGVSVEWAAEDGGVEDMRIAPDGSVEP